MKKYFILVLILQTSHLISEQLIHSSESIVINENIRKKMINSERKAKKDQFLITNKKRENEAQFLNEAENLPQSYFMENGKVFINSKFQIIPPVNEYLKLISVDGSSFTKFQSPLKLTGEGDHKIIIQNYNAYGILISEEETIYSLDSEKPKLTASLDGFHIIKNGIPYFNEQINLKIHTTDLASGINEVYIKINSRPFTALKNIERKIGTPGQNELRLKSVDNVSNQSPEIIFHYFVDNESPDLEIHSTEKISEGEDGQICEQGTKLSLSATDSGVGLQKIMYRKNHKPKWKLYKEKPFRVKKDFILEYMAEDELGNHTQVKRFSCKIKRED
jgi:hypothetical protein